MPKMAITQKPIRISHATSHASVLARSTRSSRVDMVKSYIKRFLKVIPVIFAIPIIIILFWVGWLLINTPNTHSRVTRERPAKTRRSASSSLAETQRDNTRELALPVKPSKTRHEAPVQRERDDKSNSHLSRSLLHERTPTQKS